MPKVAARFIFRHPGCIAPWFLTTGRLEHRLQSGLERMLQAPPIGNGQEVARVGAAQRNPLFPSIWGS
ncbi:MAG: hypothetical protein WBC61_06030, partial [Dehalococcoidia bacterium]